MKNIFNSFWDKYQIFIWPILGVGISIALLGLVIIPQILKVFETNTKIEQVNIKITALDKKVSDLKQINLLEYKENFNKLNITLPTQIDVPSAISQIQSLAANSNIQLVGFSISLPASDTTADNFVIRLDFKGDISSVNNFITQIKKAPRLMSINKIDLAGDKKSANFQVTLELQAYFSKQQTTLSGVEDAITLLTDKEKQELINIESSVKSLPIVSEETIVGPKGKSNPFE